MPIEVDELLNLINFEKPEDDADFTIEDVRNSLDTQFVPVRDIETRSDLIEPIVAKHIGQRIGSMQTKFVSLAKNAGLEITHSDFKDKKFEEVAEEVFGGIGEKLKGVKQPDDKISKELERVRSEYGTLKEEYEGFQNKYNETLSTFEQEKKSWAVNHEVGEAWKSLQFAPDVDEIKRVGFETILNKKYKFEAFEDGIFPVYNEGPKAGSRVKDPTNAAKDLKPLELLKLEGEKSGLLAKHQQGRQVAPPANGRRQEGSPNEGGAASRIPLNPRFAGQGS